MVDLVTIRVEQDRAQLTDTTIKSPEERRLEPETAIGGSFNNASRTDVILPSAVFDTVTSYAELRTVWKHTRYAP